MNCIKRILSSININNKDIVNLDKTVNGEKYIKFEEKNNNPIYNRKPL